MKRCVYIPIRLLGQGWGEAMIRSIVAAFLLIGLACSAGCSSIDCFRWWGRNSDGSSNLAHNKPSPIQAGPIAGTYQNPVMGTVVQPPSTIKPATTPPVVVSSPVQAAPPPSLNTSPPVNLAPPGVFPQQPPNAPPEILGPTSNSSPISKGTDIVENRPSIPSPVMPDIAVKGPNIDLTVAGASSPSPLLIAPTVGNQAVERALTQLSGPSIPMPQTGMPQMPTAPNIPVPPMAGMNGTRTVSLNPGTVPPPLAPPPQVPQFENR